MMDILTIDNLFGGYISGLDVLRGVNLSVRQGEVLGVVGLNGSGKSTFAKAMINRLPYRSGLIKWLDKPIMDLGAHQLKRLGISYMPQGGQVFEGLSVWDNLTMSFNGRKNINFDLLSDIFPLFKLSNANLRSTMADQLSGGQRHQLALAMSLASNPNLVILDEPSAGLSPLSVIEMYEIFSKIRKHTNMSIVLIEQNIAKAIQNSDRVVVFDQGKIAHTLVAPSLDEVESILFDISV